MAFGREARGGETAKKTPQALRTPSSSTKGGTILLHFYGIYITDRLHLLTTRLGLPIVRSGHPIEAGTAQRSLACWQTP